MTRRHYRSPRWRPLPALALILTGLCFRAAPATAQAGYPPLLSDAQERELTARMRQHIFRVYLPLLARPTAYKAVHQDPIPNATEDWAYQRQEVKDRALTRVDRVDARSRARGGMSTRELERLTGEHPDWRPEHLRQVLRDAPRIDDVEVELHRAQPLDKNLVRLDFDVTLHCQGASSTTAFRHIDVVDQAGVPKLPARLLLDVACPGIPLRTDAPGRTLINLVKNQGGL